MVYTHAYKRGRPLAFPFDSPWNFYNKLKAALRNAWRLCFASGSEAVDLLGGHEFMPFLGAIEGDRPTDVPTPFEGGEGIARDVALGGLGHVQAPTDGDVGDAVVTLVPPGSEVHLAAVDHGIPVVLHALGALELVELAVLQERELLCWSRLMILLVHEGHSHSDRSDGKKPVADTDTHVISW